MLSRPRNVTLYNNAALNKLDKSPAGENAFEARANRLLRFDAADLTSPTAKSA